MFNLNLENIIQTEFDIDSIVYRLLRNVSGTYRSEAPAGSGTILELRVDVDGRRPMNRLSGDFFRRFQFWGIYFTFYQSSFIVEAVNIDYQANEIILKGTVHHYNDPSITNETIEVRIPRVSRFAAAPGATVRFYKSGALKETFCAPKISEYFRTVTLEIDRYQGTSFPPTINTHVGVHPSDITNEDLTTRTVFQRAGIDLTVIEDDVLNDADSADPGDNWDVNELHDLMEANFDRYANTLQWNLYGVVVPKFGSPNYSPGFYGVMFDWGGYQTGDTYLRQGAAIAEDAIRARAGSLYDTDAKRNRLILQTFIHEIGHAFNLPHSWSRSNNADAGSNSYMNYPWGYTGGGGGETAFWQNFRWEFDDVELIWMRHQNRNDVIFGGNDWIGNNLSVFTAPEMEMSNAAVSLELRARDVYDYAEPVQVELKLKNVSGTSQQVNQLLHPEYGFTVFYIDCPNGDIVQYVPPVRRDAAAEIVTLENCASIYESVLLSYSANGAVFTDSGEYQIRAYYFTEEAVAVSPRIRIRVATPKTEAAEELAHLMFSPEAAKFIYLDGSTRYPETAAQLEIAAKKFVEVEPRVVRHIHKSLGLFLSRDHKVVVEKQGKRVLTSREAQSHDAIEHLSAALKLPDDADKAAIDNITRNRLAMRLSDVYLKEGASDTAIKVLKENKQYFEQRKVVDSVLKTYQKRIDDLN